MWDQNQENARALRVKRSVLMTDPALPLEHRSGDAIRIIFLWELNLSSNPLHQRQVRDSVSSKEIRSHDSYSLLCLCTSLPASSRAAATRGM